MTNDELIARVICLEYLQALQEAALTPQQLMAIEKGLAIADGQILSTTFVSDAAVLHAQGLLIDRRRRIRQLLGLPSLGKPQQ